MPERSRAGFLGVSKDMAKCLRGKTTNRTGAWLLMTIVLLLPVVGGAGLRPEAGREGVFFAQGQAVPHPQDQTITQQGAINDFQTQGLLQAVGGFLSPSEIASHYSLLQEKILSRPERYVQTYQVFTEGAGANGLYRVTGQVVVTLDILVADLEGLGLNPVASQGRGDPPAPAGSARIDEGRETPPVAASKSEAPGRRAKRILWVVAEKWDQTWAVPQDEGDPQELFFLSVLQDVEDYGLALLLPRSGEVTVDERGNIASGQVLDLARDVKAAYAVWGHVILRESQDQPARLEVSLRVVDSASGKAQGDIQRHFLLGEASNQEGALELASKVVPQLDAMLSRHTAEAAQEPALIVDEPPVSSEKLAEPSRPAAEVSPSRPQVVAAEPGEWVLRIRAANQYAAWRELEAALRQHSKAVRVKSLELGPEEGVVRLEGMDGGFIKTLETLQLRGGLRLQVDELSPEKRIVVLSFLSSEEGRTEKQP